jgi:hypothetical protein
MARGNDLLIPGSPSVALSPALVIDQGGDPVMGADGPRWRFGEIGPFYYETAPGNWAIYLPVFNASTPAKFSILKSTDGGQNWAIVVNSPRPALSQSRSTFSCDVFGSIIRFYYGDDSDFVASIDFDMATNLWGEADVSTELIGTATDEEGGVLGVRRSDGSDVLFWQAPDVTAKGAIRYMVRNGAGSWGTAAYVETAGALTYRTMVILRANNDRVYFFYRLFDDIKCRVLTPTNVLKSQKTVNASFSSLYYDGDNQVDSDNFPFGRPALVGDKVYLPSTYNWNDFNVPTLCVHTATDDPAGDPEATTPTFSATAPSDRRTASFSDATTIIQCDSAVRNVCGVPWVIWCGELTWRGHYFNPNSVWLSKFIDGDWTNPPDEVLLPSHDVDDRTEGTKSHDSYYNLAVGVRPDNCQLGFVVEWSQPDGRRYLETTDETGCPGKGNYVY